MRQHKNAQSKPEERLPLCWAATEVGTGYAKAASMPGPAPSFAVNGAAHVSWALSPKLEAQQEEGSKHDPTGGFPPRPADPTPIWMLKFSKLVLKFMLWTVSAASLLLCIAAMYGHARSWVRRALVHTDQLTDGLSASHEKRGASKLKPTTRGAMPRLTSSLIRTLGLACLAVCTDAACFTTTCAGLTSQTYRNYDFSAVPTSPDNCAVVPAACNDIGEQCFRDSDAETVFIAYGTKSIDCAAQAFRGLVVTLELECEPTWSGANTGSCSQPSDGSGAAGTICDCAVRPWGDVNNNCFKSGKGTYSFTYCKQR
eukprot:scaffold63704_cov55-Phaeocystis_antarctica.AAC.5